MSTLQICAVLAAALVASGTVVAAAVMLLIDGFNVSIECDNVGSEFD